MPYRKDKQRLLAGALSLLPPGDKIPDGAALRLQNWRVDQAGQLKSRRGLLRDSAALGAEIHTLFRTGNDRLAGVGTALRYGASLGTTLASGFDGQPMGIASYQGYSWVMNQGKQGKVKGTAFRNWVPAAPATAPTVSAGSQEEKVVVLFESGADAFDIDTYYFTGSVGNRSVQVEHTFTSQGTIALENGSSSVVGSGTNWSNDWDEVGVVPLHITFTVDGFPYQAYVKVDSMTDATHLKLADQNDNEVQWSGATVAGISYRIYQMRPAAVFASGGKDNDYYQVTASPSGRWRVQRAFGAKDLRFGGEARDDDKLRFWFFCNNQPAIQSFSVTLFDSSGNSVYADISPKKISPASGSWTLIDITRKLNPYEVLAANAEYQDVTRRMFEAQDNGDRIAYDTLNQTRLQLFSQVLAESPYFRGVGVNIGGAYQFDWSAVTEAWFEVVTTEAAVIGYDRCVMIGGFEGALDGEMSWYVTFDTDDGHESNPSPASEPVMLSKQPVTLSGIPVSSDPQVTRRNIYGIGGRLDKPLLFHTINDNVTSNALITAGFDEAQARNREMPTNADAPPAARGCLGPYFGKIVAWNSAAHPNRIWWTPTAQPWKFPGSSDDFEGNWIDAGGADEAVVWCTDHTRMLVIYKDRSIWRLLGDPNNADPEKSAAGIGLVGPRAVCSAGTADYFVGPEGVYRFTGDWAEKVSQAVDPIFKGDWTDVGGGVSVPPVNDAYRHLCALEHCNGRLYLSYPDATSSSPNVTLVYDIESGRWSQERSALGGFTRLYNEGQGNAFLGAIGGALFQRGRGVTDDGQAIPLVWQSGYFDQGLPDNPKAYGDLVIVHRTAESGETPSTLTVKMYFDNGKTVTALGSINSTERTQTRFPVGVTAMNCAVLVEGDARSTVTIYEAYIHYYVEARLARTYDTGVIDLAGGQVGELEAVGLDVTAPGSLTLSVYTDLPGGTLAQRATQTWSGAAGRRTILYQFPARPEGRRGRIVISGDLEFQAHRVRMKVLPVGVYLSPGEAWEPEAIA